MSISISKASCTRKFDRISDLHDDILVRILSSLTMKEAGITSVLSKRWKHVWAYLPNLNFEASEVLDEMWKGISRREQNKEEAKYFSWVDQVVSSHRARAIDEFRVRFSFEGNRHKNFDHWLRFAMEKKVKRLEFNILAFSVGAYLLLYNFPSLPQSTTLTSLQLAHVQVTGRVLQKFLSDCRNLELLSVSFSDLLVDLKVHSLKLKSLKILKCFDIKHLEICAPNLISFDYYGLEISWPLKDAPNVTELFIGGDYGMNLLGDFSALSRCMSQLEVFTLTDIGQFEITQDVPKVFPVASRLKTLNIGLEAYSAEELFFLNYLIKSCPLLHKFELELFFISDDMETTEETREVFPHDKLKILDIKGFAGSETELGFVMHLIKTLFR